MVFYIGRRILSAISVVLVVIIVSFALFFIAPTDPAGAVCGSRCTPARVASITHALNLDKPKPEQVADYFEGLFVGHTTVVDGAKVVCSAPCLGYSYKLSEPVTELLGRAIPVTISIVIGGAVVFLLIGVTTGVIAARFRGTLRDRVTVVLTQGLGAIPYFIWILLWRIYGARGFPQTNYTSIFSNPLDWITGLLLAWVAFGIFDGMIYTRYVRGYMIESLGEDYVRTARAKGVSERRILWKHALRATLTPITTIVGLDLAAQLTGALITEKILQLPGLGMITLNAFNNYDLPVLMGAAIFGSGVLVLMNLVVDIIYTFVDPRVRLS